MAAPVIHWFRRDLRLNDNTALDQAFRSGQPVLPLFIIDPQIVGSPYASEKRTSFWMRALHALAQRIADEGGALVIAAGDPVAVLMEVAAKTGAISLYANADYSPLATRRDQRVKAETGLHLHLAHDALLLPPGAVLKDDGSPYTVFTPFKRRWNELPKPQPVADIARGGYWADTGGVMPLHNAAELNRYIGIHTLPTATETHAQGALQAFIQHRIATYRTGRNHLVAEPFADDVHGPSVLSPYLRAGLLSPRHLYWAARAAYSASEDASSQESIATWVSELTWREFYMHILSHFPRVSSASFRPEYDSLPWRDAPEEIESWRSGMTGYPIVDAAMRQLVARGWISNRARMITASFLTKHLLHHWQAGERFFMQHLVDGDPAANNGGWQWTAGTGTDAAPYFRIFNPILQSRKFGPDGAYIRHWVPELAHLSAAVIHAPWESAAATGSYPPPIVDHGFARERALDAFAAIRRSSE